MSVMKAKILKVKKQTLEGFFEARMKEYSTPTKVVLYRMVDKKTGRTFRKSVIVDQALKHNIRKYYLYPA